MLVDLLLSGGKDSNVLSLLFRASALKVTSLYHSTVEEKYLQLKTDWKDARLGAAVI